MLLEGFRDYRKPDGAWLAEQRTRAIGPHKETPETNQHSKRHIAIIAVLIGKTAIKAMIRL